MVDSVLYSPMSACVAVAGPAMEPSWLSTVSMILTFLLSAVRTTDNFPLAGEASVAATGKH